MVGPALRSEPMPTPRLRMKMSMSAAAPLTGTQAPGQKTHTGSGIAIDGFRRGTIEYCEAYQNGALCDATESGGPVGIWAYNFDRALLQFNKSHHNHSNNQADGGGFDLDGGTTNSVMRYNVSWGNDGYGFQLWDFFWGEFRNNRIHHNVSLMDCERWRNFGAFVVFGRVMSAELYRNVAYLSADSPAVEIECWDGAGLRFSENVYLATGDSQPFSITESPGVGLEARRGFPPRSRRAGPRDPKYRQRSRFSGRVPVCPKICLESR